ncbi:nuclear transport factor 2 family protein [Janthinobacterium agaricidamnosum]|uniref:SnoaL-like domain-containing protein n=1 Tax=Janthinobacterium agaricidamnosum NBRC 102515 = DSM 9628 TaxID=1349767 RepID=W0VCR8_9BURK|nr:nuclear transport factor 2 family protein [Janthinobacterium agaricidamnosum]CDG85435.1 putative uncharacterized protein [Janthinobacterium agaricidamnosum NBRC 102515 = DSM 9628]
MSLTLPQVVADYFHAENTKDIGGIARCFASDGVVRDNNKVHQGHDAIKAWKEDSSKKYSAIIVPDAAQTHDERCTVSTTVSGNFPGSPLQMAFAFTLAGDGIAMLEITA